MTTQEKIRDHTTDNDADHINEPVIDKSFESFKEYMHKGKATIINRLKELDDEWEIERLLQMNASGIAIAGIVLGILVNKKWFILPGIAATFLLLHAVSGWAPPVPVLKKLGFRTRDEINRERYALKALKGDFKNMRTADAAWNAAE